MEDMGGDFADFMERSEEPRYSSHGGGEVGEIPRESKLYAEAGNKMRKKKTSGDSGEIATAVAVAVIVLLLSGVGIYASSQSLKATAAGLDVDDRCPLNEKGTKAAIVLLAASRLAPCLGGDVPLSLQQ